MKHQSGIHNTLCADSRYSMARGRWINIRNYLRDLVRKLLVIKIFTTKLRLSQQPAGDQTELAAAPCVGCWAAGCPGEIAPVWLERARMLLLYII